MAKFSNSSSAVYKCPNANQIRAAVLADLTQNPPLQPQAADDGSGHLVWAIGWSTGSSVPTIPICPKCGATLIAQSDNDSSNFNLQVQVGNQH